MTLQQIHYVLTIAKAGSLNRAAKELYITQPALTSTLQELESEIGITIFHRSKQGATPTVEGTDFIRNVRQIYQQYELLMEKYTNKDEIKRKFGVSTQHYSFAVQAFIDTTHQYDTSKFEFAIRETETQKVIQDVASMRSEIGILYVSNFNHKIMKKIFNENDLEFHPLVDCQAYVYLWKGHPLAGQSSITFEQLKDYPCLTFEQDEDSSAFFAEEILSENEYPRIIHTCDRATMMNLAEGMNGYTLCSGIVSRKLTGSEFVLVPYEEDEENPNSTMEIGYLIKKHAILSTIGEQYIEKLKEYLQTHQTENMQLLGEKD